MTKKATTNNSKVQQYLPYVIFGLIAFVCLVDLSVITLFCSLYWGKNTRNALKRLRKKIMEEQSTFNDLSTMSTTEIISTYSGCETDQSENRKDASLSNALQNSTCTKNICTKDIRTKDTCTKDTCTKDIRTKHTCTKHLHQRHLHQRHLHQRHLHQTHLHQEFWTFFFLAFLFLVSLENF